MFSSLNSINVDFSRREIEHMMNSQISIEVMSHEGEIYFHSTN